MKQQMSFPPFPLKEWQETKDTIHLFLQIVGKIRLQLFPKKNHWWHVPFYVSVNGLTTDPIPYQQDLIEIEFNFRDHTLHISSTSGDSTVIQLSSHSVAEFYQQVLEGLRRIGVQVEIVPKPYDIPHIPFNHFLDCHEYDVYNKAHAEQMWRILVSVNNVFQEFRGQFLGKSTPVHLFWHHFDLALTRFSGRPGPLRPEVSQVEREAYSHEVISFGFWFGDDKVPEPAFYAYGYPAVHSVYEDNLLPEAAIWSRESGMALLRYSDILNKPDPGREILQFLESTYAVYAHHMNWPTEELELAAK